MRKLPHPARCVAVSPDGKLVAVGFKNGSWSVFECGTLAEKREPLHTEHHRKEELSDIRFSPATEVRPHTWPPPFQPTGQKALDLYLNRHVLRGGIGACRQRRLKANTLPWPATTILWIFTQPALGNALVFAKGLRPTSRMWIGTEVGRCLW